MAVTRRDWFRPRRLKTATGCRTCSLGIAQRAARVDASCQSSTILVSWDGASIGGLVTAGLSDGCSLT